MFTVKNGEEWLTFDDDDNYEEKETWIHIEYQRGYRIEENDLTKERRIVKH